MSGQGGFILPATDEPTPPMSVSDATDVNKIMKDIDDFISLMDEMKSSDKHITTPKNTVRFVTQLDDTNFLKAVLDNIISQSQNYTYSLEQVQGLNEYLCTIISVADGRPTSQFIIDPRYRYGAGIPMIKVPITDGTGNGWMDWVPLGAKDLVNFPIFSGQSMVSLSQITLDAFVPRVCQVKTMRELWPSKTLYKELDMSELIIRSGKEYQDFGYYAYQVLRNIEAQTKIKGRWRVLYESPMKFKLYSDAEVRYPHDMEYMPLGVMAEFDGGEKIIISSLLNDRKQKLIFRDVFPYPANGDCDPLTYGEKPGDPLVIITDAEDTPEQKSNFEKEYNRNMSGETPVAPVNPNAEANIYTYLNKLTTPAA